jgi:hypothetical protein
MTDEDTPLLSALQDVQASFALDERPPEVLADGMSAIGETLADLAAVHVTLYSPIPSPDQSDNPALRDDLSQPVAEAETNKPSNPEP